MISTALGFKNILKPLLFGALSHSPDNEAQNAPRDAFRGVSQTKCVAAPARPS